MITTDTIKHLAEQKLINTDKYIVDIIIKPGNKINVLLDCMSRGISINDCVEVSRQIESNLDREKEDFELNVSSAGIDRPFKVIKQYFKNIGKQVEVNTTDNVKLIGTMVSADENGIELEIKPTKKEQKVNGKQTAINQKLTYNQIKETKIVISF